MAWGNLRSVRLCLLALVCMVCAVPAVAQDRLPVACHTYSDAAMPANQALRNLRWTCSDSNWQNGRAVDWLRFNVSDRTGQPRFFASRISRFDGISITAVADDGSLRTAHYTPADARPASAGPLFILPLPGVPARTSSYIVSIKGAHSVPIASEAALYHNPDSARGSYRAMLLLAIITGLLIMPLLFDALFYMVLRERFVLLHAGMTIVMVTYILTSGGVINGFVELPIAFLAVIGPLAWAIGVGLGGLFVLAFLERDALPRWLRRVLEIAAVWTMVVAGFAALQLSATQSFDNQVYFYTFVPIIPLYLATLIYATIRGSRAARFLIVAWLPVLLASTDRLLRGLGFYTAGSSIDMGLFIALALEVLLVALGVADRLIALRRERDLALSEARSFEQLTEHDPLTGLFNRRALQERFAHLRAEGFHTLAIVDLDQFKDVNDRHGHVTGDLVLRTVGQVLNRPEDSDLRAFRMGGEEFLLLLRGKHSVARAEKLRAAIATEAAAHKLEGTNITASMGVVEAGADALPRADFESLYARADRLLYEAKSAGRNRTVSESVKVFRPRRGERRAA